MLKPILSLSAFLILAHSSLIGQYSNADNYISQYKALAINEMSRTGIPASIKMGQAILESAAGTSTLATKAYNHFGVKCGSVWQGDNYGLKDDERMLLFFKKKSCFRKYNNAEESYMDHSAFLTRPNSPYQELFKLDKTDYKGWAYGLKKAGYATAGDYPEKLIGIIERYHLYQLDDLSNSDIASNYKPSPSQVVPATKPIETKDRVIIINQVKAIVAKAGETPLSISKATNTNVSNILDYNDKIEYAAQTLNENDIVYLQKKKKTYWGKNKTHIVGEGESMFSISQQYGVRLDMLFERNNMNPEMDPAVGQTIYLRGERPSNESLKVVPKNQAPTRIKLSSEPVVFKPDKKILTPNTQPSINNDLPQKQTGNKILVSNTRETVGNTNTSEPKATTSESRISFKTQANSEESSIPLSSSENEKRTFKPKTSLSSNKPAPTDPDNLDFTMEPAERIEPTTSSITEEVRFKPALTGAGFPGNSNRSVPEKKEYVEKPETIPNNIQYHTVTAGDTLYNISKRYDLSVTVLKDLNDLPDNNIKLGQKLKLK